MTADEKRRRRKRKRVRKRTRSRGQSGFILLSFLKGLGSALAGCVLILAVAVGIGYFTGMLDWVVPADGVEEAAAVKEQETPEPEEGKPAENPLREEEEPAESQMPKEEAERQEKESIRLLFAGDLFLTELLQEKYQSSGISAAAAEELLEVTKGADVFMVNNEFPYGTTGEAAEDKQYTFRIAPEYVSLSQELGVDIVTLANNHVLDFGTSPLSETLAVLDEAGIAHVGAGENLEEAKAWETFEIHGTTVGFLGASRVIPENSWNATKYNAGVFTTYDASQLVQEIGRAKEVCDYVVVYVHWGIERNATPEDYQKALARQYIDAGADAVIGSHPHVLQGIEYYQGKPICYSLGNYIFANRDYETMMVELTLTGGEVQMSVIPCVSKGNRMGLLSEKGAFYENLETLSFGVSIDENGIVAPQS